MGSQRKHLPRSLLLILAALALGMAAGGFLFLRVQQDALLRQEGETLDTIAVLKVNQVSRWREDRLAEANAIAANSLFNEQLRTVLEGQAGSSADQVREWMQALLRADSEYTRVELVAADGKVRMSVPPASPPLSPPDRALIDEAFRRRQAVMSEFHVDDPAEGPSLGVAVPLLIGGPAAPAAVGALLLRIDPDVYLYPLIQLWPTSSPTGQTLLVRREGADVLYLNELGHQPGTALTLRFPLTQTTRVAAMAVTGRQGVVEGVDYRGERVLAALRPVPSTPWFMVSKIDRQEVLAPLVTIGWLTGAVVVSLFLAMGGGMAWVWRRQAATEGERELSLRTDRDAQAQRAEYFWRYANDSILLADLTGRIVEANDRAVTSLGYPREQLVGMDLRDLRVPEQRVMVDEVMRRAREHGGCIVEADYRRGDGSVFAAEDSARVIEQAGQEYYLSVTRDISERKQAEDGLRESEGRYRSLFENMLEGYAYCRMLFEDGRPQDFAYLAVNDAFETLTGLKDVVGRRVSDVIPGIRESDPQLFETYGRVVTTGIAETFETYLEGLSTWFHISVYRPKAEHFVAVFDVITERKRSEEALRRYTEQLKAATRLGSLISTSFDLSEIFDTLARGFASFLPIDRVSLILLDDTGESWQVTRLWTSYEPALTADTRGSLADSPIGAVVTGRVPLLEREIGESGEWPENDLIRQEGIHSRVLLPLIVQGRVIGVLTLGSRTPAAYTEEDAAALQRFADQLAVAVQNSRLFDEVRRRAAELEQRVAARTAELQAANQELEAFSYSVSHDLRAPLRAIDGFSRILEEENHASLSAEAQRYLALVRENALQMGTLIDALLSLSRLSRQPLSRGRIYMSALAQEALRGLEGELGGRQIELVVADLPEASGDPVLLRQVFVNLLSNAIKFTSKKDQARIEIGSMEQDGHPVYFVRDNGEGFDMRYVGKLFGVFQRLHRSEEYPGSGVGLAIVQRIIRRHGGRVWAEGRVGEGATFNFTLEGGAE